MIALMILKALGCIALIIVPVVWIVALASWDGKKLCKPEDCDTCPFPPCRDGHINKTLKRSNYHDRNHH